MNAVIRLDEFTMQICQPEFHQLDEIQLVIHNQDARNHVGKVVQFRQFTMSAGLKAGYELETKLPLSAEVVIEKLPGAGSPIAEI